MQDENEKEIKTTTNSGGRKIDQATGRYVPKHTNETHEFTNWTSESPSTQKMRGGVLGKKIETVAVGDGGKCLAEESKKYKYQAEFVAKKSKTKKEDKAKKLNELHEKYGMMKHLPPESDGSIFVAFDDLIGKGRTPKDLQKAYTTLYNQLSSLTATDEFGMKGMRFSLQRDSKGRTKGYRVYRTK